MPAPLPVSSLPNPGDAPSADGLARGLVERQLGLLGRLAEAGLNIALTIERQVAAVETDLPEAGSSASVQQVQGLALAYGRVSRAVRLTIALQSRLVKDLQEIEATAARRRAGEAAEAGRERLGRESARKERVERIVERMIRAEVADEAEVDRLADEAYERLDDDDIYGDLSARPVSEIIELVSRDLGLAPDWDRLAQEAWAQAEIDGGAAGSPLVTLRWQDPPAPALAAPARRKPPPKTPRAASP
jgi:HD-GYP domain-containing protein (c-di-GMP phosphodiesterase class II)